MKNLKKVFVALGLLMAFSSIYAKMPMYAKAEIGFKGGSIFNSDLRKIGNTYATFGNINAAFGFSPIPSLPQLGFEAFADFAFCDFKTGTSASVTTIMLGSNAIWTFAPESSWSFFAGAGFEVPIETIKVFTYSDTTAAFAMTGLAGIKAAVSDKIDVMVDFDVSFFNFFSWGFNAGAAYKF